MIVGKRNILLADMAVLIGRLEPERFGGRHRAFGRAGRNVAETQTPAAGRVMEFVVSRLPLGGGNVPDGGGFLLQHLPGGGDPSVC